MILFVLLSGFMQSMRLKRCVECTVLCKSKPEQRNIAAHQYSKENDHMSSLRRRISNLCQYIIQFKSTTLVVYIDNTD